MNKIKGRIYSFVSERKEGMAWTGITLLFLVGLVFQDFFDSSAFLRTIRGITTIGWFIALAFAIFMDEN